MHICEHTSLLHIKIIIASVAYFLFLYTTKLTYAPIQFTKLTPYITYFSKYMQTHNATQVCKLHCSIQIPMEHKKKTLRTQFTYYTYLMLGEANAFATNGNFVHKTI